MGKGMRAQGIWEEAGDEQQSWIQWHQETALTVEDPHHEQHCRNRAVAQPPPLSLK